MKTTAIARFTEVAEKMDFSVNVYGEDVEVGTYSPAGQDFSVGFKVDKETMDGTDEQSYRDIVAAFAEVAESYDPDEEVTLWIGPDGHGMNGAPYNVRDILADMDECKKYLMELWDELNK